MPLHTRACMVRALRRGCSTGTGPPRTLHHGCGCGYGCVRMWRMCMCGGARPCKLGRRAGSCKTHAQHDAAHSRPQTHAPFAANPAHGSELLKGCAGSLSGSSPSSAYPCQFLLVARAACAERPAAWGLASRHHQDPALHLPLRIVLGRHACTMMGESGAHPSASKG